MDSEKCWLVFESIVLIHNFCVKHVGFLKLSQFFILARP